MDKGQEQAVTVWIVALPLVAWGLERLVESAQPRLALAGSCGSLSECVQKTGAATPDVLVLDLDAEANTDALTELHSHSRTKVLAITHSQSQDLLDSTVLAGARGLVSKRESPATLLKAIEKVHEGEIWLDRNSTGRIFMELARKKVAREHDPDLEKIASLTRREQQTIASLASDPSASGKQVAERLFISENTLRNHLTSIYSKLGLNNRVDLYAFAHKHGLSKSR